VSQKGVAWRSRAGKALMFCTAGDHLPLACDQGAGQRHDWWSARDEEVKTWLLSLPAGSASLHACNFPPTIAPTVWIGKEPHFGKVHTDSNIQDAWIASFADCAQSTLRHVAQKHRDTTRWPVGLLSFFIIRSKHSLSDHHCTSISTDQLQCRPAFLLVLRR
jgi:hypothetical protein